MRKLILAALVAVVLVGLVGLIAFIFAASAMVHNVQSMHQNALEQALQ